MFKYLGDPEEISRNARYRKDVPTEGMPQQRISQNEVQTRIEGEQHARQDVNATSVKDAKNVVASDTVTEPVFGDDVLLPKVVERN
jgi:hypothetical protein